MGARQGYTPSEPAEFPTCTFLDIETVRGARSFADLSPRMQELYAKRYAHEIEEPAKVGLGREWSTESHYEQRAGFSAEFGRIVAVSMGKFVRDKADNGIKFKMSTFASRDEKELLTKVGKNLQTSERLCGHNGIEFDFPYLFRRYLINGMHVPKILNIFGKRGAWDYPFDDTMAMWSHAQWKGRVSLDLLTELFGISSPKNDIDGSMIGEIFYNPDNVIESTWDTKAEGTRDPALEIIGSYCAGDVVACANVFCTMHEYPLVTPEMIVQHAA